MSLPTWLQDPALLPVWQQLRGPLERGNRTTRLTGLSREARHALRPVLGRPVTGDVRVALTDLDARLGRPLVEVVEALTGPCATGQPSAQRTPSRWPSSPQWTRGGRLRSAAAEC